MGCGVVNVAPVVGWHARRTLLRWPVVQEVGQQLSSQPRAVETLVEKRGELWIRQQILIWKYIKKEFNYASGVSASLRINTTRVQSPEVVFAVGGSQIHSPAELIRGVKIDGTVALQTPAQHTLGNYGSPCLYIQEREKDIQKKAHAANARAKQTQRQM